MDMPPLAFLVPSTPPPRREKGRPFPGGLFAVGFGAYFASASAFGASAFASDFFSSFAFGT